MLDVRSQSLPNVLRQLRQNQKRRFLQFRRIGRHALEDKRQQLRPPVLREDPRGELGDGVANLLGDRFDLLALDTRQHRRFEGGLSGEGETRPQVGVVAREELAEEDGGHGAALGVRGELEEVSELQGEGIGIGLLGEIEESLGGGALFVGRGHEVGDEGLEGRGIGAEDHRELCLLGSHCGR